MFGLRAFMWIATGIVAIALLTQPVSVQAQLSLSVTIIGVLVLVWIFARGKLARQVFLALASFNIIRYIYWRTTYTLPPTSDLVGLTLGLILLAAELYCVVILIVSLIVGAGPSSASSNPGGPMKSCLSSMCSSRHIMKTSIFWRRRSPPRVRWITPRTS